MIVAEYWGRRSYITDGRFPETRMIEIETTPVLTSGAALWKSLSVDKARDRELERDLKSNFGCPMRRSLPAWVKRHNISAATLLIRLLESIGPYVKMWQGILTMFELAQARLTRRNLLISFDFSESSKLKSDLDHFRTQVNTAAQTVQVQQGLENWEPAQYWGLIHMLEKHTLHGSGEAMDGHADERDWITGYYVGDPAIDAWIDEYLRKRRYPAVLPEIPESNEQKLDQQLVVVREILRTAIDECRLYGVDREGLRMRRHELPPLGRIPSRPLAFTDSDHTLGRLLTSIWRIATQFRETANVDGPRAVADELLPRLWQHLRRRALGEVPE